MRKKRIKMTTTWINIDKIGRKIVDRLFKRKISRKKNTGGFRR